MQSRLYQPIWQQIKLDKEAHLANPENGYTGTVARDVRPTEVKRVDKAVRKEKTTYDGDNWALGRYLKLQSEYNHETFELTFKLVPYRKYEARARILSKLL
jgi:hypothetical protein